LTTTNELINFLKKLMNQLHILLKWQHIQEG
jgi:hypothetical protein